MVSTELSHSTQEISQSSSFYSLWRLVTSKYFTPCNPMWEYQTGITSWDRKIKRILEQVFLIILKLRDLLFGCFGCLFTIQGWDYQSQLWQFWNQSHWLKRPILRCQWPIFDVFMRSCKKSYPTRSFWYWRWSLAPEQWSMWSFHHCWNCQKIWVVLNCAQ